MSATTLIVADPHARVWYLDVDARLSAAVRAECAEYFSELVGVTHLPGSVLASEPLQGFVGCIHLLRMWH